MSKFISQISQVLRTGTRGLATVSREAVQTIKEIAPKSPTNQTSSKPLSKPTYPQKIYKLVQNAITKGEPHFRVGGKQLYFPTARVILLRPNAKHTPYQAKFIVPKSFNKMDLRDYLYHLYGLRVFKITTQLLHGKYERNGAIARYRSAQIKKMTVDLMDPFIWPEEPEDLMKEYNIEFLKNIAQYSKESSRQGSDKFKPGTAFNGAVGPFPRKPEPFVTKSLKKRLVNLKIKESGSNDRSENEKLVSKYLDL